MVNQSLVLRINICDENRHLRQAPNRYASPYGHSNNLSNMKLSSLFSLIISVALFGLLFWGLTKFIVWYPTFYTFLFYFLAFLFAWSIRIMPSKYKAIKAGISLSKTKGYSTFEKSKVSIQLLFLAACWWFLIQSIISNYHLYQGWTIIGLICFMLFVILSTLTLIAGIIVPMD